MSKDYCKLKKPSYPKHFSVYGRKLRIWAYWNQSWYAHHLSGTSTLCFTSWISSGLRASGCSLRAAGWQVFFPFWVSLGLTSPSSMVAAIADDHNIHYLLIWLEIFHFSTCLGTPHSTIPKASYYHLMFPKGDIDVFWEMITTEE